MSDDGNEIREACIVIPAEVNGLQVDPMPGSVKDTCTGCGRTVWVSRAMFRYITERRQEHAVEFVCAFCAFDPRNDMGESRNAEVEPTLRKYEQEEARRGKPTHRHKNRRTKL